MKIAINGSLGSGKSTVAKALANLLGYRYVSTGAWFRQMAVEAGVDIIEFSAMAEQDPSIDAAIDNRLKALSDSPDNLVIDSRMAPFFIEEAVKIRLAVSDEEGAKRIMTDLARGQLETFDDFEAALSGYRLRSVSERKRYFEQYGVDLDAPDAYDLIIDTSNRSAEEVTREIYDYLEHTVL